MSHDLGTITYLAPDLVLTNATEEEKELLREIGWNLEADVPYLERERVHNMSMMAGYNTANFSEEAKDTVINLTEVFNSMDNESEDKIEGYSYIMPMSSVTPAIYSPVPPHGSKVYWPGDRVHCNRFNGPNTNNRHYGLSDPRAYINFL